MANNCLFRMRAIGKPENLAMFFNHILGGFSVNEKPVCRVYSVDESERTEIPDTRYEIRVFDGDCAWSVDTAFDQDNSGLDTLAKKYNLFLEGYSLELGMEFQEHFIVSPSRKAVINCIDYEEKTVVDDLVWDDLERLHGDELAKIADIPTRCNLQSLYHKALWSKTASLSKDEKLKLYQERIDSDFMFDPNTMKWDDEDNIIFAGGYGEWTYTVPAGEAVKELTSEETA